MPTAAEEQAAARKSATRRPSGAPTSKPSPPGTSTRWPRFWEPGAIDELHGLASTARAGRDPRVVREHCSAAVPDFRMEVLDLLADGEKVAVRWHMTGTFSGDARFEGAIATGAAIDITGCDVLTVRDGKIRPQRRLPERHADGPPARRVSRPGLGPGTGDDRRRQRRRPGWRAASAADAAL